LREKRERGSCRCVSRMLPFLFPSSTDSDDVVAARSRKLTRGRTGEIFAPCRQRAQIFARATAPSRFVRDRVFLSREILYVAKNSYSFIRYNAIGRFIYSG
jgi:hypothetical protein